MCGIAGWVTFEPDRSAADFEAIGRAMGGCLAHRGPDDAGVWVNAQQGVALAHQRLSIIDLSHQGHQPMASADGRYRLVYNGEIYNHLELRRDLEAGGVRLRGGSDTEVLIEAIARWGLDETLPRLIGMFAFGVWDAQQHQLTLIRDRLGIKPLYYGWAGNNLLFASELKAFLKHPDFTAEIDRNALALFVQHNYIPAPYSIYRGIWKLPPGKWIRFGSSNRDPTPRTYWDPIEKLVHAQRPFDGSRQEASERLECLILDATRLRMRADVPWGAFLSGGIDSSLVVAAMQAQSDRPVHTFSIGFEESGFDEAPFARAIARHLGTNHTEHYVMAAEARDVIPLLPAIYDEPFADSSQIPTFLVCQLARQSVTVSLSGDGGDELFGGYDRYQLVDRLWRRLSAFPAGVRTAVAALCRRGPAKRMRSWSRLLETREPRQLYWLLNRHWDDPARLVPGSSPVDSWFTDESAWRNPKTLVEQMMLLDTVTYLPDDILVKVDRASMALGLEVRVPLLDHRVVEFCWSLPFSWKFHSGETKHLLKSVLARHVPRQLTERPKVGFGVPIGAWLRGPLRDWAEALLDEGRLRDEGYFAVEPVREHWNKHLSQRGDWHYWLWDILMFQAWLEAARG